MSRTFSLWELMAVVTVLCLVCALAVNFPAIALMIALVIGYYLPTIVICGALPWLSSRPVLTLNAALLGALVSFWIVPPIQGIAGGTSDFWDVYIRGLQRQALPAAFGALLTGIVCVGIFPRWKKPRRVDRE